jgi:hypothetical protein
LKKENKAKYIEALAVSQDNKDSTVFVEFMMDSIVAFIRQSIEEFKP